MISPRLPTSTQWTALPAEFLDKVKEVFANQFPDEADVGEFVAEGQIYPQEIVFRIGHLERGRLKQMNFEASVSYAQDQASEQKGAMARIYLCVDAAASMMEEYFTAAADAEEGDEEALENLDFPVEWKAFEFDGEQIYLRTSTVNSRLEEEADRLLGASEQALVRQADTAAQTASEDALSRAVIDNELAFHLQKQIRNGFGGN